MEVQKFERKIKHLKNKQILQGSINAITKVLVSKGLVTEEELQDTFMEWVNHNGLQKNGKVKSEQNGKAH